MNHIRVSLAVFAVSTMLSACVTGDPTPIPRGYSSYLEPYKSAPGPSARPIGYAYTNEKNNIVVEDSRYAAADLAQKLDQQLSFAKDKIYLMKGGNSAFYNTFDHLLRDELLKRGYVLSSTPVDAVSVAFTAKEVATDKNKPAPKWTETGYRPLYLALMINVVEGVAQHEVSGVYEVPVYDFKASETISLHVPDAPPPAPITRAEPATPVTRTMIPVKAQPAPAPKAAPVDIVDVPRCTGNSCEIQPTGKPQSIVPKEQELTTSPIKPIQLDAP